VKAAPGKAVGQYMFSAFGLVDFFATMPHYLHMFFPTLDLRILRVLRLLRILKLSKYNTALQDLFSRRLFRTARFRLCSLFAIDCNRCLRPRSCISQRVTNNPNFSAASHIPFTGPS
jgi:hypothetical protein